MLSLQYRNMKVDIEPELGARVVSFMVNDTELLWMSENYREEAWIHGGIPILFPFAGRVYWQDSEGLYNLPAIGTFPMPIHGFVHKQKWELQESCDTQATFNFSMTSETKDFFPFAYSCQATWHLKADGLYFTLSVANLSVSEALPLAAGLHPYFDLRVFSKLLGGDFLGYFCVNKKGLADDWTPFTERVNLEQPDFQSAILSKFSSICLLFKEEGGLKIKTTGENIVLWQNPEIGNFVCVEPWMNLPNAVHQNILWLKPRERKEFKANFCLFASA